MWFRAHGVPVRVAAARPPCPARRFAQPGGRSRCAQEADVKFQQSSLVIVTASREIKFEVELATNDAERAHGLMFRKQLGAYEGMLFDFFKEMPVSFWMKNTLIPLDMVFIARLSAGGDHHDGLGLRHWLPGTSGYGRQA